VGGIGWLAGWRTVRFRAHNDRNELVFWGEGWYPVGAVQLGWLVRSRWFGGLSRLGNLCDPEDFGKIWGLLCWGIGDIGWSGQLNRSNLGGWVGLDGFRAKG